MTENQPETKHNNAKPLHGISAVLNTYNAEQYLEEVLTALRGFDEIVIADMHSTDRTIEIARRFTDRIIQIPRSGICETGRNDAISLARYEWVLVIDADELVSPRLREFLYDHIRNPKGVDALRIPRRNFFMGKEMHCLYPDYVLRFARRDKIYWPPTIHSIPKIEGKVGEIHKSRKDLALYHLEKNTIESRMEKIERYTDREVERRGGRRFSTFQKVAKPAARFFHSFVLKGGWRDGRAGLEWARLDSLYKRRTMEKQEKATK